MTVAEDEMYRNIGIIANSLSQLVELKKKELELREREIEAKETNCAENIKEEVLK